MGSLANRGSGDAPVADEAEAPPGEVGAGRDDAERAISMYREYYLPLLGFATRLTGGDRYWAEDVVQETLLRAWRRRERLRTDTGSLMPWLGTTARRIVIDHRRRRDVRPAEVSEENLGEPAEADRSEHVIGGVVAAEALRSLSAAHREVLLHTVLRDRTVNQAAQELGLPVGTVKSRVYYALRALRTALDGGAR